MTRSIVTTISDRKTQIRRRTRHRYPCVCDLERAARSMVDENGVILSHQNLDPSLNGYWVEAKDLQEGDIFLDAFGGLPLLVSKERVEFAESVNVYNFTVEGNHNYFVLAEESEQTSLLVHNAEYDDEYPPGYFDGPAIPLNSSPTPLIDSLKTNVQNITTSVKNVLLDAKDEVDQFFTDNIIETLTKKGLKLAIGKLPQATPPGAPQEQAQPSTDLKTFSLGSFEVPYFSPASVSVIGGISKDLEDLKNFHKNPGSLFGIGSELKFQFLRGNFSTSIFQELGNGNTFIEGGGKIEW